MGAVAEMATLGAVIPFLGFLADPGKVEQYPWIQKFWGLLGLQPEDRLVMAAVLFGLIAITAACIRILLTWVSSRFTYGLGGDFGAELYRQTLAQPYSWHISRNSSEILAGLQKVNSLVGVVNHLMLASIAFVLMIGILAALIVIDAQTALTAAFGFTVFYGITSLVTSSRLKRHGTTVAKNETERVKAIQEGLGGIRNIILDGTHAVYQRRFEVFDYGMRRGQASMNIMSTSPRYLIEASGMIMIVGLALSINHKSGGLYNAIPVLGALALGAQKLLPQMQQLYFSWSIVIAAHSQIGDVLLLLDPVRDAVNSEEKSWASNKSMHDLPLIELKHISYRYISDGPDILKEISLAIYKGERIGLIGKTGGGKSTLVDIIMGLLSPTAGVVLIDGKLLSETNKKSWQSRISHVPQAIYLADSSIAENIAFGIRAGNIDKARVSKSAGIAHIENFIKDLPDKYETLVGERGVRLSGGQRQRIGLARAFYKGGELLTMDEATNALDGKTEESVMASIQGIGQDITIIMIAHRLSTLRDCHRIIEMENGRIKRIASYQEIISDHDSSGFRKEKQ